MRPVPLAQAHDAGSLGGKAVQLGTAIRAGLPVPGGFALEADMVAAVARGEAGALEELRVACSGVPGPLAVRSSAVGEDSAAASFAGQHATVLNVIGPDRVVAAVMAVWQSAHTDSAAAYRKRMGAGEIVRIGVVIQKLVAAETAGVLFTRNPVTGRDERVIEAGWGLGEAIVQGLVIPDRYRLSRDGEILERVSGFKEIAVRLDAGGYTRQETVAPHLVSQLCLDDHGLRLLHELAIRCDEVFGSGPHDIEWAIEGRELYLLQRRPVTV